MNFTLTITNVYNEVKLKLPIAYQNKTKVVWGDCTLLINLETTCLLHFVESVVDRLHIKAHFGVGCRTLSENRDKLLVFLVVLDVTREIKVFLFIMQETLRFTRKS